MAARVGPDPWLAEAAHCEAGNQQLGGPSSLGRRNSTHHWPEPEVTGIRGSPSWGLCARPILIALTLPENRPASGMNCPSGAQMAHCLPRA